MPPIDAAWFLGTALVAWSIFIVAALLSPPVEEVPLPVAPKPRLLRRSRRLVRGESSSAAP